MFVGVGAIALLIPLISLVGFPTMNAKSSFQSSSGDICKDNALKYEQLGYYKGEEHNSMQLWLPVLLAVVNDNP